MNIKEIWVRRDRDDYILLGMVAAMIVSSYTMAYWFRMDSVNAYKNMRLIRVAETENAGRNLRESGLSLSRQKATTQKYYKIERGASPEMPGLGEEDGN